MIDEAKIERLLRTARAQIDGILNMVSENKKCLEISSQISATQSLLKKVNLSILSNHLNYCMKESFENDSEQVKAQKIDELISSLNTLIR